MEKRVSLTVPSHGAPFFFSHVFSLAVCSVSRADERETCSKSRSLHENKDIKLHIRTLVDLVVV